MRGKAFNKSENMIAKIHSANGKKLVAVCDSELLGKMFKENGLQLDLTGNFYNGEEVSKEELGRVLKGAHMVNFVGKESVEFGIKKGVVKKENVITIAETLHAQSLITDT